MELEVETKRQVENSIESKYMKGVKHLCESGVTRVPSKYILPISDRPNASGGNDHRRSPSSGEDLNLRLPLIDLAELQTGQNRQHALDSLAKACADHGFFQVINHGIPSEVIRGMIDVGRRFFELPFDERARYMSPDLVAPVRYGTSFNQNKDSVFCWRDFLKLSCHPLPTVLPHWPSSPTDLRERATSYAKQTRRVFLELVGAILETLGVEESPITGEVEESGTQMMVVNYFPPCPEPDLTLGMHPHSDYGFLTLVLQDQVRGLQIQSTRGDWVTIDPVPGSILVNVGDHLEIFSNGRYKSVLHRVLVNSLKSRISVASLHSLPVNSVVSPSPQLVDDEHPRRYRDTNFAAFLEYLSAHDTKHKSFLETRMY